MPFASNIVIERPASKPRVYKRDRPLVPPDGPYGILDDELLLNPLFDYVGGQAAVQAAQEMALGDLLRGWIRGAGLGSSLSDIEFFSRAEYDKLETTRPGRLYVCRDTARMQSLVPGVVASIYAYALTKRKRWQPRNVYASQLKEDRRQLVLALLGVPESDTIGADHPEWSAVADFGTALHTLLERWLKALGVSKRSEFSIKYEHQRRDDHSKKEVIVSGRGDHEVFLAGRPYVLDVKTVGLKDYEEGAWGRKFEGYRSQVNFYSRALYLEDGIERDGIILLACRDTGRLSAVVIKADQAEGDALILRGRAIMRCRDERRLPPGEKFGRDALFNPYRTFCALQDETGWVQRALDEGHAPKALTVEFVRSLYAE